MMNMSEDAAKKEELKTTDSEEALNKAIDSFLEDLFETAPEKVEKMMTGKSHTTADAALAQVETSPEDKDRDERPKDITTIPKGQGEAAPEGEYDADITSNEDEEKEPEEAPMQSNPQALLNKEITVAEFEEYQALKKAKEAQEAAEEIKKSQEQTEQLIKSATASVAETFAKENEELKKSVLEMQQTLQNMANRPQQRKSIESISVLEKSQKQEGSQFYSKEELEQAVEDLVLNKSHPEFKVEHMAEMEQMGTLNDENLRRKVDSYLKNK